MTLTSRPELVISRMQGLRPSTPAAGVGGLSCPGPWGLSAQEGTHEMRKRKAWILLVNYFSHLFSAPAPYSLYLQCSIR